MTRALIGYFGFLLGTLFGIFLFTLFSICKDPPKPHTTCKDCVHRNKEKCPFYHLKQNERIDTISYQWRTDRPDDFYCKEAQSFELEKRS